MNLAQRAMLTHRGRVALATVYVIAALASVLVYTVMRSVAYGISQVVVLGLGLTWIIWCIRRTPAA